MSEFPIVRARQRLGFTPSTAVRANIDVRTGEGQVGAAIGQGLLQVGQQVQRIQQKRRDMTDTRSAVTANSLVDEAVKENIAFRETNADTTTWPKDLQERLARAESRIGQLDFSDDRRILVNAQFQANSRGAFSNSLIAETRREADDTRGAVILDVTEAVRSGNEQDKTDSIKRFGEIAPTLWDDAEARSILSAAVKAGQEGRNKDAIAAKRNQASIFPEAVEAEMKAERELRATGKTTPTLANLTGEDLVDIQKFAKSAKAKKVDDSKLAADAAIKDSFSQIRDGATNLDDMIDAIDIDPNISAEDSIRATKAITSFFGTWNSTTSNKVITSNTTRIKALKIKKRVLNNDITVDEGLDEYAEITDPINPADNKQFINNIFAAGDKAENVIAQRQNDILSERENQLRDAIEKQPSFFPAEEAEEILKDFANKAVIELNDKFREGDFTKEEVDIEVDRLIKKFALTESQQLRAVSARQLELAENLEEQQNAITKIVESLRKEGQTDGAKDIMDEAIRLGIFERDGDNIKRKKGKDKRSLGKKLLRGFAITQLDRLLGR